MAAGAGKEKAMKKAMTNKQFRTIFLMIVQILKDNDVADEVIKKIEALIPKD